MNYPSIKEYKEAILFAEDNFEQLKNLRPVLGDDGEPVFSSGNFAVVFKMKDEQTGKKQALKCFLREQEGRAEAYRMIAEELEFVSSTFLTPIKYLDKELFVDTNASDDTEFPVLLMDWVEGETLDKYIRNHLDDQYELSLLAYQFSRLAMWLMPQPFAHGDLKPDNILVKRDGTLVLVDYDGMYVPAMKGQRARELGSPDFRHPSRTETDFDEHIDDFSLASILLSLKAIALQPSLLEEYGAQDRLLFSGKDYRNLSGSKVMDALKLLMQDAELASLYSLFILAISQNNLSGVSFRLFSLKRPSVSAVLSSNKNNVNQSNNRIIKKELLATFHGKKNVMHIVASNGTSSYFTPERSFDDETNAKGACKLNTVENEKKHVLFLFNDRDAEVGRYYIGKKLQGLTPVQLTEIKNELCFFESWNPDTKEWVPCVGKVKIDIKEEKLSTEVIEDDLENAWTDAFGVIYSADKTRLLRAPKDLKGYSILTKTKVICESAFKGNKELESISIPEGMIIIGESAFWGCDCLKSLVLPKSITSIEKLAFYGCSSLSSLSFPDRLKCIGDRAFYGCYGIKSLTISSSVEKIGVSAFEGCVKINSIFVDEKNKSFDSRERCNAIIESSNHKLILGCSSTIIPNTVTKIGDNSFFSCVNLSKINIPNSVKEIGFAVFPGCDMLKSVTIPQSVTEIGNALFLDCRSLSQVDFLGKIKKIPYRTFYNCKALLKVSIPDSVNEFGDEAFGGCSNIQSIVVPIGTKKKYEELLPEYKEKLVEQEMGWTVKETRQFNAEEIAMVSRAEVVASQYGNSVCFFMNGGGQSYIPLSKQSKLAVGDELDLKTAKLVTLCRMGYADITRVIE